MRMFHAWVVKCIVRMGGGCSANEVRDFCIGVGTPVALSFSNSPMPITPRRLILANLAIPPHLHLVMFYHKVEIQPLGSPAGLPPVLLSVATGVPVKFTCRESRVHCATDCVAFRITDRPFG